MRIRLLTFIFIRCQVWLRCNSMYMWNIFVSAIKLMVVDLTLIFSSCYKCDEPCKSQIGYTCTHKPGEKVKKRLKMFEVSDKQVEYLQEIKFT
jgi:hypothetical protein